MVLSGVGPGLGRALGDEAARMGADLVLASRTQKRLDAMAEVVRSHGRRALVVPTDIDDEDACQALVDAALEEFGRVDCLINNAFAIPPMEPLTTLDHDALRRSLETNALAPLRLSALFADALAETPEKRRLDHHGQLRGAAAVAAGVRRLQDDQGHAGAPRLLAGHRARPARHPGQHAWRRAGSTRTSTRPTSTGWPRSAASPTRTSTARSRTRPTSSGWRRREEVAQATLFLASDLASRGQRVTLDVSCGEFHGY